MKNWVYIVVFLMLSTSDFVMATDYYVNDNSTMNDVYCSAVGSISNTGLTPSSPLPSLSDVIAVHGPSGSGLIAAGDNFYIDAGIYYQTDANLGINLDDISIIGAGSNLTVFDNDAASSDANRWANIYGDNILIQGVFITGYNYGFGDAIALQIDGAQNFTINDVKVNENLPGGGSAAIFITGSSTGTFNGGGASCNPPNPSIAGGGVNIQGDGNLITFNNYNISNNSKDVQGGAGMRINGNNTTIVTISNSLFEGNETDGAEGGGGILILNGANLTITGTCFNGNNASQSSSINYGGAINVGSGSSVDISNCSFDGNFATSSGNGGAISINSDLGSGAGVSSVTLSSCSFSNNAAADGNDLFTRGGNGESITAFECTWSLTASEELHIDDGNIVVQNSGNPTQIGGVTFVNTIDATNSPLTVCPLSGEPCYSVILPVELAAFEGKCQDFAIELKWQTVSEYNNAFFIVERAGVDGQFELIAKTPGSLNSSDLLTYYFTDEHPKMGLNYYRLSQVDVDGRSESFEPITVNNNCAGDDLIVTYVARDNALYFSSPMEGVTSISVLNMAGQLVEYLVMDPHEIVSKLQLKNPPGAGVYLLKIDKGGMIETGKVLITK